MVLALSCSSISAPTVAPSEEEEEEEMMGEMSQIACPIFTHTRAHTHANAHLHLLCNRYMRAGACCKHYVAYDLEGNGPLPSRVFFDAQVDTRSFWEHYMPGTVP